MAYVIGQPCIGVKDTACVDACPVDSIHSLEGSPQYYIEPATCIDCSACEPVCPVKAIWAGDQVPADQKKFIAINADFFKGFDKSKSTAYTRQKKGEKKEEGEAAGAPAAGAAQSAPVEVVLKEVEGWEPRWEAHENEVEDRDEVQKRYGRVRTIFEQSDQYIIRIYLPEKAPNHPFRYKYGLPEEMSTYTVSAVLTGNSVSVLGKVADPRFAKLCGHANSFPDRFHFDYPFPKKVSSVSVKPRGPHVVDVVGIKSAESAIAA
ncbi:MAG TPA: ferredoxin family protein [Bdellovibrionota bacterium]|nr:ferredoxin family protein [Bdellovibrionota bacterium]